MIGRIDNDNKRDIHGGQEEFDKYYEGLKHQNWKHDKNKEHVNKYLEACMIGEAKSNGRNKRISKEWLYRVGGQLKLLSEEWLDKEFDKATIEDWREFYKRMETDQIKNQYGKFYKPTTRAKIYKTIRKFAKWKYGNNREYPSFCADWVTSEPKVTKQYLTRQEIDKLLNNITTIQIRTLVAILFDTGMRIQECCNIRFQDVQITSKGYYQFHLRPETTKTKKERYVTMLLYSERFKDFLSAEEKRRGELKPSDYLFPSNYNSYYITIARVGKKILNKNISPHMFRHSSATYFADVITTYQQFCTRYGWSLNSDTAQRYYHRINDDQIVSQVEDNEISKFKYEFEKLKLERNASLKEVEELKQIVLIVQNELQKMKQNS